MPTVGVLPRVQDVEGSEHRAGAAAGPTRPAVAAAGVAEPAPLWLWPVLTAFFYLLQVVPRLRIDGPLWFVHLGRVFLRASSASSVITPSLGATSRIGYDGQFYFAAAADPGHAHQYIQHFTSSGVVYSRGLYPALARVLGLGGVEGVAYALLLINLAATVVGTLAIADWLRRRGTSSAYALLYGLYPGLVFCVFRDLTEPLAFGLAALAVWVFDRRTTRATWAAAGLMAGSLLTRETTALFAVGLAIALVGADWHVRKGVHRLKRGSLFLVSAVAPLLVWRLAVTLWLGASTQENPGGLSYLVPFHAYAVAWPWKPIQALVLIAVTTPTVLVAIALASAWTNRDLRERWLVILFFMNAIVFVAYLPAPVFVDYGAAGRAALGVVLAFIYCLPALRMRPVRARLLAAAWSPLCYIAAGTLLGLPAIRLLIT